MYIRLWKFWLVKIRNIFGGYILRYENTKIKKIGQSLYKSSKEKNTTASHRQTKMHAYFGLISLISDTQR